MVMGRHKKSKEWKDEKRRLRQKKFYENHKDRLNKKRMDYYWRTKEVDKEMPGM